MSKLAIVLVHGFSGDPADLKTLTESLALRFGHQVIYQITLPEHPSLSGILHFEEGRLIEAIAKPLTRLREERREIVVIGHSSGGNLVLRALEETGIVPALVILAATPFAVGADGLDRWVRHRNGRDHISLTSIAALVSLINSTGAKGQTRIWPLLLLVATADELVPEVDSVAWLTKFSGPKHMVKIAHAGHHLFACNFNDDAIVAVESAISNLVIEKTTAALLAVEPESRDFLEKVSSFASHFANTPSGRRLIGLSAQPTEQVDGDPIFANIEITRRCDLTCRYCARTHTGVSAGDMSLETFRTLLSKLSHAYRITLVGLGEPLLHPQLVEMVSLAANQGRRIALVTNAMALDDRLTSQLLEVGLDSIAFSIDAADPDLVSQMRPGSDIQRITSNIRRFTDQARRLDRPISMAVFSAISREGVSDLSALVRLVGTLGVHVLMLSDLNFAENVTASLSAAPEAEISQPVRDAVSAGFACNLPVLTVRALEEFGLAARYQDALLLPTEQLYRRSSRHRFCHSPWQTLSVNVRGDVALCDCQPERLIGNILEQPLAELWNSTELCSHRRQMRSDSPPKACRICPRF